MFTATAEDPWGLLERLRKFRIHELNPIDRPEAILVAIEPSDPVPPVEPVETIFVTDENGVLLPDSAGK